MQYEGEVGDPAYKDLIAAGSPDRFRGKGVLLMRSGLSDIRARDARV